MKKWIFLLAFALLLTGCQKQPSMDAPESTGTPETEDTPSYTPVDTSQLFSDRDFETDYDAAKCIPIVLQGDTASGNGITVSGSTVTISQEGCYLLSGQLNDGMILIDATNQSKIQLIMNQVTIHSSTSAPIYVRQADKVFITLAEGSTNTLSCGESYVAIDDSNIDSAIFSKDDLTLNGNGTLTIFSPAGHGIVSKDDLRITGGSYAVTAAGHGFSAQDRLSVADGSFTVSCGKDGFHCENDEDATLGTVYIGKGNYEIVSDGDGISAGATLDIENGSFTLLCGGGSENGEEHSEDMFGGGMGGRPGGMFPGGRGYGEMTDTSTETDTAVSAKGLKAAGPLTLTNGAFIINSADDALHSNNNLTVSGGSYQIATGDDGFHADEALSIQSGKITITDSYEGLEGLTITVSGGEINLKASDDGLNAAGGNDESGFGGMGGRPGGMGGSPGGMGGFGQDQFGSSSESFILISGGKLFVDADGDGIDSNGNLMFSGGYTVVEGPTNNGNGPLDYGGSGSISGGTILISGSSGMAQSLTSTQEQGVIALQTGTCTPGTTVTVADSNGNTLVTLSPEKQYACVIISTPDIQKGQAYTVTLGDQKKTFTAQ